MDAQPNRYLPDAQIGNVNVNDNRQVAVDDHPLPDDEDIQLQLTLGFTHNVNQPPAAPSYAVHQNDGNNERHVARELQPLVFRPLSTNTSPSLDLHAPPPHTLQAPASPSANPPRRQQQPRQLRSSGTGSSSREKGPTIEPPYPWATDKRCQVHPSAVLKSRGQLSITGRVKCRKCERSYEMAFDLDTMFMKVGSYILEKKEELCHRAPEIWMNPVLPDCAFCPQRNAVKPEIEGKKRTTNWLFLFLGQMLGCCTGEQLKYFCKHNGHHRTAAKDRLLYLAYLSICRQLDPNGPFNL